jgi:hypothetical protein
METNDRCTGKHTHKHIRGLTLLPENIGAPERQANATTYRDQEGIIFLLPELKVKPSVPRRAFAPHITVGTHSPGVTPTSVHVGSPTATARHYKLEESATGYQVNVVEDIAKAMA